MQAGREGRPDAQHQGAGERDGAQSAAQAGTQAATQVVSQDLTCTFTNGNGTKTFHRDGVRDGERTGTRTGSRAGSREGSRDASREGTRTGNRSGSLGYDIDVDARKANQYTGLKGWKGEPSYEAGNADWNAPTFGDWSFGDWSFGGWSFGDYAFGDYEFGDYTFEPVAGVDWGAWDAAPGENPDDCRRSSNADKITALSNVITPAAITDGPVTDGAVVDGAITPGSIAGGAVTEGAITYGAAEAGARNPAARPSCSSTARPSEQPHHNGSPRPDSAAGAAAGEARSSLGAVRRRLGQCPRPVHGDRPGPAAPPARAGAGGMSR
ncbi:hypothetical protein [Kitasatospora sp. KL5]|uniref:hypothetical protein n=1 Tax=Kitasatospora sp. KL5 TaxID=3425125 RepID=UPI003D6E0A62